MGILDKLKPQPRWKHADVAVRLEAVSELDDQGELATLAEHDSDAAVRRAAIAKLGDPATLGRVSAGGADSETRDAAADRLLALALEGAPEQAVAAAGFLADVRRVSALAKSAAADAVRAAALAKLADERALGGVARHAQTETTALAAAARLSSPDELLSTALNSDHREVALAVFDRIVQPKPEAALDVVLLETIAARAQQKAVARRAKTMLQEIEDAENARRAAEVERQRQAKALCAAVEDLVPATDPERAAAELGRIAGAWDALVDVDPATAERFATGVEAVRARIAQRRATAEADRAAATRRDAALASREALHRRAQALTGDDVLERVAELEAEWDALAPLVEYEAEAAEVGVRFRQAAATCRARHARAGELRDAREQLAALVAEAETLSADVAEPAVARWKSLSREARTLAAKLSDASEPASDLTDRLEAVARVFEAQAAAAREADEKAKRELATKLARLADRAKRAVAAETITLREGERLLRDVTAALDEVGAGTKETRDVVATLRGLQDQLAPRVKELRDMDDWRRFANVQLQEELIAMAEAIVASLKSEEEAGAESDLAATAKALRELHLRWREAADVPHHLSRKLWDRFKTATDFMRSRCEVYFAKVREERSANLAAKRALVEQAEELAGSTDWNKTAGRLQELQKAWDESGPVERESGRDLARRFRAACNTFFTGRRGALSSMRKEWDENLARREALCERAEALSASTDWDATASELKKLQSEWKTIGPVSHKQREAIWNRFRAAADAFFARYHDRHKIAAAEKVAEHAAVVASVEGLLATEDEPADLGAQVQSLRTAFGSLPRVESAEMTALQQRLRTALAALAVRWPAPFAGTDLDAAAIHARLEKLVAKVERFLQDEPAPAATPSSDTASLADRLRSALANNAMGVRPDETKWRAARKAVEEAQEAWRRMAVVATDETRALEARLTAACGRVMEQVKRHVRPSAAELMAAREEERGDRGRRKRPGGGGPPGSRRSDRGPGSGAPGGGRRPNDARPR